MGVLAAAAVVTAVAATYSAYQAEEGRKDTKAANKRTEARAVEAQQEQEALAEVEQQEADVKLEEQRARILKGQKGRGGLLFGSELGVTDETTKTTLGA